MQRAEAQHKRIPNKPVARPAKGMAIASPRGERIAQLKAVAATGPRADRLARLAAMANGGPRVAAQRKIAAGMNSGAQAAAQQLRPEGLGGDTLQRAVAERALQPQVVQRAVAPAQPNRTGLPDNLKNGIEAVSGISMDSVRVHYNSSQPAQLNALAYAQGTDIHVAAGQEEHLPHAAWHLVQQAQGRVRATAQMKRVGVSDDEGLAKEADAVSVRVERRNALLDLHSASLSPHFSSGGPTIQLMKRNERVRRSAGKVQPARVAKKRRLSSRRESAADQPAPLMPPVEHLGLSGITLPGIETDSPSAAPSPAEYDEPSEGVGVRFTMDGENWNDGFCTEIAGGTYTVHIADKLIRDLYGETSVQVPRKQVRTSLQIRGRLGRKKTKSSKRNYSSSVLASGSELQEVQGLYSAITPWLLRNPVAFGPLLRNGGHVGRQEVEQVGKELRLKVTVPKATRGKSKNRPKENAIVANDTNAMLATRFDDLETGAGEWVIHGRAAADTAIDHPRLAERELAGRNEIDLGAFRGEYIFQQGGIKREVLKLPEGDRRTKMHAEAKAVRSLTWRHIIAETIREFVPPPREESAEAAQLPKKRKIISIVINRSACGSRKKSGFSGGCAGELASVIKEFWTELARTWRNEEYVEALKRAGLIILEVSVGAEYEHAGESEGIVAAGGVVRTHPTYDYAADMPQPLTAAKCQYMKRLDKLDRKGAQGSEGRPEWLASLYEKLASERRPTTRVAAQIGQADVTGLLHREHPGDIACTSIAAYALEQLLSSPGMGVTAEDMLRFMRAGTDIDADLRERPELPEQVASGVSGKRVRGRYFAHDEVQDRFPGMEVHQEALDELEPQYLFGVRGDYRRIARQLSRMGPDTGLLVTTGANTIMVANMGQEGGPLNLALFDSHETAIFETYSSEEGLTEAIEELYPALPGVDELSGAWQATPYRRRL